MIEIALAAQVAIIAVAERDMNKLTVSLWHPPHRLDVVAEVIATVFVLCFVSGLS